MMPTLCMYTTPSGATITLTPAMMADWACTLVCYVVNSSRNTLTSQQENGQATLNMPPNLPSFNVAIQPGHPHHSKTLHLPQKGDKQEPESNGFAERGDSMDAAFQA